MDHDDLRFTANHEWVRLNKFNVARIGITDFAQRRYGDAMYVELPEEDSEHEQFDPVGVIEGENILAELCVPFTGRIVSINEEVEEDPTLLNNDPMGDGWLFEIELAHEDEMDDLMTSEEYEVFVRNS